uniref:Protein TsetseEP domain-containing protein n=1 Tax=Anopheles minimus TaxID=112268 RepID=A0A182WJN5_9DIPT
MYALAVSVALACILQVAHSSPDFGIQGTISGVAKINERAVLAKEHFLRVDDYIIPTQKSDISKLRDAAVILQAIGLQVNTLGPALIDALTTASDDDSGNIEATFSLISMARITFEDYINIVLQEQIQNLETLLGIHVRDQLIDDFYHIANRLTALDATLALLQGAVQNAHNAANGGPVSDALVRQFVDADLIAQLTRHLTMLAYRIPVLTYTITSSLENIQQADEYYYGLRQDSDRVLDEIDASGRDFNDKTVAYSTVVEQSMNQLITDYTEELVLATATATELNVAGLTTAISGLKAVQDTKLAATLKAYKDLYLPRVLELSKLLPIESNFSFLAGENPAAVLVGVLIANGPFSRYCFWKYASLLHNILLTSNFASECYDREYNRLQALQQALLLQIEMISFNQEIINPYSSVCLLPASASQRITQCATEIAAYFNVIATEYDAKLSAFVKLAEIELNASKERLSVCWSSKVQQILVKYKTIVPEITTCAATGPQV